MRERCIVVPALKKHAAIPDQLVKRLAGETLIERAIHTARAVARGEDVLVVTDSQEITLICERRGVRHHHDPALRFAAPDIVAGLAPILAELAAGYEHVVIYRASCPLVTWVDIEDAWRVFMDSGADCLLTVKNVRRRVWTSGPSGLAPAGEQDILLESRALVMLRGAALLGGGVRRAVPYYLNDRAVEIGGHQDWWICEKLLARRRIVFVVAGYPEIGMGHIYRALMLAQEITDHEIIFLCTRESGLAAREIAEREHKTIVQRGELADEVLDLRPDLVVNDILDTGAAYMAALKEAGVRAVNFEDEGAGAALADLVVNALYEDAPGPGRYLCGHKYFCLRDEFVSARRNVFRDPARAVLVSFGGTDNSDFTRRTLDVIEPRCRERGIAVRVVAGPGYARREELEAHLERLASPLVSFTYASNVMSRMMEGADMAICSAGRTVYELAHMRVPGIVMAHHERELSHRFARAANGFIRLGMMNPVFHARRLERAFVRLLAPEERAKLFARQGRFTFAGNKERTLRRILALLESGGGEA